MKKATVSYLPYGEMSAKQTERVSSPRYIKNPLSKER